MEEKKLTGYPSIDKPWLKHYAPNVEKIQIPHKTLFQYAHDCNRDSLNGTAFRYFGAKITYKNLFDNVYSVAKFFQKAGIANGDIVTIMSLHTPETIYAFYALNYLGATANMVYLTLSSQEILATIKETKSKMLLILDVALPQIESIMEDITIPVVVMNVSDSMPLALRAVSRIKATKKVAGAVEFKKMVKAAKSECLKDFDKDDQRPAVIVYTSGTTGNPKGVMLSSYNINSVAFQYKYSEMHLERGETYLDIIPLFLAYGVSMLQLAVTMGIDTTLLIVSETKEIAKQFDRLKPNHFASGPTLLDDIMKNVTGNLNNLINFTGGGAALSPEKELELNNFLFKHGSNVKYAIGYGMTELSASVSACNNKIYKSGSLGIPLPKATLKIVDIESGEELSVGQEGEICFNAPNIMLGYYKNPTATDNIIHIDENGMRWIHTGDLGLVDNDGFLFYKGKMKRIYVVKIDGQPYKLFPQRMEELFEADPDVDKCAVVAIEDDAMINVAVAFVTKKSDIEDTKLIAALETSANNNLPKHMQPSRIIVIDKMPLTASGKINYKALEKEVEKL